MRRLLITKCPKCKTNRNIIACETIEATTEFEFIDGVCASTNNEYGNGVGVSFICNNCGHKWYGRKGVSIDNYTETYD